MTDQSTFFKKTQIAFNPHVMIEMSEDLGLSLEKTQQSFQAIMPSLLMAFCSNPKALVNIVNEFIDGETILQRVFGNELTNVATMLQHHTDLPLPGVIKMFEKISPRVVEVLKEANPESLTKFLNNERTFLAEKVPTDISNYYGFGASDTRWGNISRFIEGTHKELQDYPKSDA